MISKFVVILFIVTLLIIVDPYIAAVGISILGLIYLLIYFSVQSGLSKIGLKSTEAILIRYKLVNEAIFSIKELKLRGKEQVFIKNFDEISQLDAKYTIVSNLIALLPRYLLESLIFTKHVTLLFCKNIYWYNFYIFYTSSYTVVGINSNIVPKYLCLLCIYLFANFQHNLEFFFITKFKIVYGLRKK